MSKHVRIKVTWPSTTTATLSWTLFNPPHFLGHKRSDTLTKIPFPAYTCICRLLEWVFMTDDPSTIQLRVLKKNSTGHTSEYWAVYNKTRLYTILQIAVVDHILTSRLKRDNSIIITALCKIQRSQARLQPIQLQQAISQQPAPLHTIHQQQQQHPGQHPGHMTQM